MFGFFKKQIALNENILSYLNEVLKNTDYFSALMIYYIENGFTAQFHTQAKLVHKSESRADDIRYAIEKLMYQHSLLPDSRGDIFLIIEELDRIPGIYEKTVEYLLIRKCTIPDQISSDFTQFLETSLLTAKELISCVEILFKKPAAVHDFSRNIDALESRCDRFEHHLLKTIFQMEIPDLQKERLASVVSLISGISDQAERVGNQMVITALKRVY